MSRYEVVRTTTDEIVDINRELVSHLEAAKEEITGGVERHNAERRDQRLEPGLANHSWEGRDLAASGRVMHHYSVPALFESLGIILCTEAWNRAGPSEIGDTSVCMFLTGTEDYGPSVPVTFDSVEDKIQAVLQRGPKKAVQTTPDTVVDFMIELESREALATAGSSSDPTAETDYPKARISGGVPPFL